MNPCLHIAVTFLRKQFDSIYHILKQSFVVTDRPM